MADHCAPEEERMEDVDLEGSEKEVTESLVENELETRSATGLSETASGLRVEVGNLKLNGFQLSVPE